MEYKDRFKEAKRIQDSALRILILLAIVATIGVAIIIWAEFAKPSLQDYCTELYGEESQQSYDSPGLYKCVIIKNNMVEGYYFTQREYNIWLEGK